MHEMKRFFSCSTSSSPIHLFQKLIDSESISPISRKNQCSKSLENPKKIQYQSTSFFWARFIQIPVKTLVLLKNRWPYPFKTVYHPIVRKPRSKSCVETVCKPVQNPPANPLGLAGGAAVTALSHLYYFPDCSILRQSTQCSASSTRSDAQFNYHLF